MAICLALRAIKTSERRLLDALYRGDRGDPCRRLTSIKAAGRSLSAFNGGLPRLVVATDPSHLSRAFDRLLGETVLSVSQANISSSRIRSES